MMSNLSSTTPNITSIKEITTVGVVKGLAVMVLIIVAICGNLLVCISFTTFRNLRSLTNYFIVSLSIADLLIAFCTMPIWFVIQFYNDKWISYATHTKLLQYWHTMDLLLCLGSIFNLTAISFERNLAITNPFYYTKWLSPNRVLVTIATLWLLALTVAMISGFSVIPNRRALVMFVVTCSYILPLLIVFTMYAKILIVARRQARRLRQDGAFATDLKAVKTIALVVGAFIVCYTPNFVVIVWVHFGMKPEVTPDVVSVARWLTYFNSCINPIIYSCFNKTYRKAFKTLLKNWGEKLQELRRKDNSKRSTTARTMQRSRLSLNMTMRSSAGSLLDGPKNGTDIFHLDGQSRSSVLSHSVRISQISVNSKINENHMENLTEEPREEMETRN